MCGAQQLLHGNNNQEENRKTTLWHTHRSSHALTGQSAARMMLTTNENIMTFHLSKVQCLCSYLFPGSNAPCGSAADTCCNRAEVRRSWILMNELIRLFSVRAWRPVHSGYFSHPAINTSPVITMLLLLLLLLIGYCCDNTNENLISLQKSSQRISELTYCIFNLQYYLSIRRVTRVRVAWTTINPFS